MDWFAPKEGCEREIAIGGSQRANNWPTAKQSISSSDE